jgi:hypothetical protein
MYSRCGGPLEILEIASCGCSFEVFAGRYIDTYLGIYNLLCMGGVSVGLLFGYMAVVLGIGRHI